MRCAAWNGVWTAVAFGSVAGVVVTDATITLEDSDFDGYRVGILSRGTPLRSPGICMRAGPGLH